MRRTGLRRRIIAPVAVLLLLLVGFRSAYAMYRCAADGVARTACCCPQQQAAKDDAGDATREIGIEAACCCDVEIAQAVAGVDARLDGAPTHDLAVVPAVHVAWIAAPLRASQTSPAPGFIHRSSGPPLRLIKQSFLI